MRERLEKRRNNMRVVTGRELPHLCHVYHFPNNHIDNGQKYIYYFKNSNSDLNDRFRCVLHQLTDILVTKLVHYKYNS